MTHLTITEDPGEEFAFRGINSSTGLRDDGVVFYADVTKVHVLPERESFTIQVITSNSALELGFAGSDSVHQALELFEKKQVLKVNSDPPGFVRITPSFSKTEKSKNYVGDRNADFLRRPQVRQSSAPARLA